MGSGVTGLAGTSRGTAATSADPGIPDASLPVPTAQGAASAAKPTPASGFGIAAGVVAADSAQVDAQSGAASVARATVSRVPVPKAAATPDGNAAVSGGAAVSDAAAALDAAAASDPTAASGAAAAADGTKTPSSGSSSASLDGPSPSGTGAGSDDATALSPAAAAAAAAAVANQAGAAAAGGPSVAGIAITVARAASGAAAIARSATSLAVGGGADRHAPSSADDSTPATPFTLAVAPQSAVNADTATSPTPALKVSVGGDAAEFGQGLANHVSSMLDSNLTIAKLQVNPAELGPIEVRIAVQGDHASVWLMSHSAVTRDALESSSTKLREMLGAQGFAQVNVDVSQRNFQERPTPSQPYAATAAANRASSTDSAAGPSASVSRISTGALDAYA